MTSKDDGEPDVEPTPLDTPMIVIRERLVDGRLIVYFAFEDDDDV